MSTAISGPVTRVRVSDWTRQKRTAINGNFITDDTTVGELAEKAREELQLPRGAYGVYLGDLRLNRSATLDEAGVEQDAELELSPEVKAAGR